MLNEVPDLGADIFRTDSETAATIVRALSGDPGMTASLVEWLGAIQNREARAAVRRATIDKVHLGAPPLLVELLRDLRAGEVERILESLCARSGRYAEPSIRNVIVETVAPIHRQETRQWAQAVPEWNCAIAEIFAATFPGTSAGLTELIEETDQITNWQRGEALAWFLCKTGSGRLPLWIVDYASATTSLLSALLPREESLTDVRQVQIERFLSASPRIPVETSPSILGAILGSENSRYYERLVGLTMQSLLPAYVAGAINEPTARAFQEHPSVDRWFTTVHVHELQRLIAGTAHRSKMQWFNAWHWITIAPVTVFARSRELLPALIADLIRGTSPPWAPEIADMWAHILRRAGAEGAGSRGRLQLEAQGLKFAFSNPHLPVSSVVVEGFLDVYRAVIDSYGTPSEVSVLFSSFDWDKGGELRRMLVDAFVSSEWPPGDLLLAAPDDALIRKLFKRLVRTKSGERFARAALDDAEKRLHSRIASTVRNWRAMLQRPDFYEAWY